MMRYPQEENRPTMFAIKARTEKIFSALSKCQGFQQDEYTFLEKMHFVLEFAEQISQDEKLLQKRAIWERRGGN